MRLAAVKPAHYLFLQPVSLGRVFRLNHALRQLPQFLRAELPAVACFARKFDYFASLFRRQPLDFFNDFNRCHTLRLLLVRKKRKAQPQSC